MKTCSKCKQSKPLSEFPKKSAAKDGFYSHCKRCKSEADRRYRAENKEKVKNLNKSYYEKNRDEMLTRNREYRSLNAESISKRKKERMQCPKAKAKKAEIDRLYVIKNTEKVKAKKREWYERNREDQLAKCKENMQKNREAIRRRKKLYAIKNAESIRIKQKEWRRKNREKVHEKKKERYRKDPKYAAAVLVRNRINTAIKRLGYSKKSKTREMLGCDYESLISHLESKFEDGMSWDNRGEWHIDHITPLASAENDDDFCRLCHYTNLQPLWAKENLSKGAKLPEEPAK